LVEGTVDDTVRTPQRPRIFLNYRREDTAGHAGRLYDQLVARFGSETVFMDLDAIRPGSNFTETIEQALDECDVFLAVIGRGWLNCVDQALSAHR
jgi:hypothetical protein